jgi:hypothetical protein
VKTPSLPTEFEHRILEEAKRVIGEVNGLPVTNLDRAWLKLKAKANDRPELFRLVLQIYRDALKSEQAFREHAATEFLAYKEHWGPIFERARLLGRPPPQVFPDPNDIVIYPDLSFKFLGPVTKAEARDWAFFKKGRGIFFMIAQEIIDGAGHFYPVEEGYARWSKVRRQYYRVNRHLPDTFKRKYPAKFPTFKPPELCPWDGEDASECLCRASNRT